MKTKPIPDPEPISMECQPRVCTKINQIWIDIPYMDHVGWWSSTIWQVHKSCRRGNAWKPSNPLAGLSSLAGRRLLFGTTWVTWVSTICMDLNSIHQKIWLFIGCHPFNHCYEVICVESLKFFFWIFTTWHNFSFDAEPEPEKDSAGTLLYKDREFKKKNTLLMILKKKDDLLGFLFEGNIFLKHLQTTLSKHLDLPVWVPNGS